MEIDPPVTPPVGQRTSKFVALAAAVLVLAAYAVITLILVVAIPQFEVLFKEMGITLPAQTRLLLGFARAYRFFDFAPPPIPLLLHAGIASGVAYLSYKGWLSSKRFAKAFVSMLIIGMGVVIGLIVFSLFIELPLYAQA